MLLIMTDDYFSFHRGHNTVHQCPPSQLIPNSLSCVRYDGIQFRSMHLLKVYCILYEVLESVLIATWYCT